MKVVRNVLSRPTCDWIKLDEVDSTSTFLKRYIKMHRLVRPLVCLTQRQTAGYGQRQAVWLTNAHACIFSMAWPMSSHVIAPHLSLQVAVALHQALCECTPSRLWLKWPNDLYNQQGKVSGILIEVDKDKTGQVCLVIGIGVNRLPLAPEQLAIGAGGVDAFNSEEVVLALIKRLSLSGFAHFDGDYWRQYDFFALGESVDLVCHQAGREPVIYQGISPKGEAMLQASTGLVKLVSAQKSLRKRRVSSEV